MGDEMKQLKTLMTYAFLSIYNFIRFRLFKRGLKDRQFTIRECCKILGADLPLGFSETDKRLDKKVYICTRKMCFMRNCIYLRGDLSLTDMKCAMKLGAIALLTKEQLNDFPCIIVDNPTEAYVKLLSIYRNQLSQKVVAVTGSVGKTSTKNMIATTLENADKTFCIKENMNRPDYACCLLQNIPEDSKYFVQEVDEGTLHSAKYASEMLRPRVAVVTNVGTSHFQNFGSYEGIAQNIMGVSDGLTDDGTLIINGDDAPSVNALKYVNCNVIKVGIDNQDCECLAKNIKITHNATIEFDIVYKKKTYPASISVVGRHNIYNAMVAFVTAQILGIPAEKALDGIKKFKTNGVRQNLIKAGQNLVYIDCFNAAPNSMKTALNTLATLPVKNGGKRVAVLGDMLEFGEITEQSHRDVGKIASESDADVIIAFGTASKFIYEEAKLKKELVFHANTHSELDAYIKKFVKPGDAVLFKASRGMHLEKSIFKKFPIDCFFKVFCSNLLLFHDI
jgi:UDP-N-acetylmuramoyl-tripeptide--D-alanyl-D-alanine ligase